MFETYVTGIAKPTLFWALPKQECKLEINP